MNYIIRGNLCGFLCEDCNEPISGNKVLLYLPYEKDKVIKNAVASTKDTFRLVTNEEVRAKEQLLIASTETDPQGNFEFILDEKFHSTAFDIDFICGNVPRVPPKPRKEILQFHLTTVYPQWRISREQETYYFQWSYCIPARWWCYIRGYFFDAWTICGHIRNCQTGQTVQGIQVTAWDADLFTDDNLGSALTDASGHFRIDYTSADFKVNFIPFNVETDPTWPFFSSGPDVYFTAEYAGSTILQETSAQRRDNVGYCLCADLCYDKDIVPPGGSDFASAWTSIGQYFNIPTLPLLNDFDTDGFGGAAKYGFTETIRLTGQAPHKRASGNRVEYRFLVSHATTPNNGAAPALGNFTKIIGVTPNLFVPSVVAKLINIIDFTVYNVVSDQSDFDVNGWFDVNNAIERTLINNGISLADISLYNYIDEDTLISLNTAALTIAPDVPDNVANTGQAVPAGNLIPIEKVAIRFEIREVVDKATNNFITLAGSGKTLNSLVINNNPSFMKCIVNELAILGNCAPLGGTIHAAYTVHHPMLQNVSINVHNNSYTVNKNLNDGFITLSNNTNAAVNAHNNASLQINTNPNDLVRCTYALTLSVLRRLHNGDGQVSYDQIQVLFFYDI